MAPDVKVETFWPIFTLVFNEVEHKNHLYPPSDIGLLLPMHEYNRASGACVSIVVQIGLNMLPQQAC